MSLYFVIRACRVLFALMEAAAFSPIMMVGAFVLPVTIAVHEKKESTVGEQGSLG
ncbi:hypothetical protein [Nostoc sp.]|uniref:hypothetical protein n=1 Tax=Nostoc sp. TaxID=1180 RepID=UPI002FEFCC99